MAGNNSGILAYDRVGSVRTFDDNGRLRVERTPISKSNICEYLGREIPDSERLGLHPDQTYRLLRDPAELERAADSFNSIPVLEEHIPTSAGAHPRELTVGSTMDNARFDAPYLTVGMVIFDGPAIARIQSGEQKELSCGYAYTADMTPGTYEGQPYDGRMINIRGNHVALVEKGRAGPDVVVHDSVKGKDAMPEGARSGLHRALGSNGTGSGRGRGGWNHTAMPGGGPGGGTGHDDAGLEPVVEALRPLLPDLSDDDIRARAASLIDQGNQDTSHPNGGETAPANDAGDEGLVEMVEAMKRAGASPEAIEACLNICKKEASGLDEGEPMADPNSGVPQTDDKEGEDEDEDEEEKRKRETDESIQKALAADRALRRATEEACRLVRPLVGEVHGMDSADAVYRYALKNSGMAMDSIRGINTAGLRALVHTRIEGMRPRYDVPIALDSAALPFKAPRQL